MLLQALMNKQKELGLADGEFARTLGISPSLWSFLKAGKRKIGLAVLAGTVRHYPDLIPQVLFFLARWPE